MIEPKLFYRELDSVLSQIGKAESGDRYFEVILEGLEQKFGNALGIARSHLFELRGDAYVRLYSSSSAKGFAVKDRVPAESDAVREVLKHGSFIYDNPALYREIGEKPKNRYAIPCAISVSSPDGQWIVAFELKDGWIREEITLFLNAVRTALNHRLYTDLINTELERVAQIQRSLLPRAAPRVRGYQIAERSQAAVIVGGDFYEYLQPGDGTFMLAIGDASGHGLPAALLVRDVVIGLRMGVSMDMRLIHTLKKLNRVIQGAMYSTNFVSIFIGELSEDGHLVYANAGHPPPFIVCGGRVTDLGTTGIALGFFEDLTLQQAYVQLEPEALLVLYSDGLIERKNDRDELFGIERLKAVVLDHWDRSPKEIVSAVYDAVFDFGLRENWEDDASLVVLRRVGDCRTASGNPAGGRAESPASSHSRPEEGGHPQGAPT
ncbi:MAG: PP2C family protein-serine/threonine phosphatase [bacterium]|nr:PP2C family protein-serine/threonine phosphatase [bacterium]